VIVVGLFNELLDLVKSEDDGLRQFELKQSPITKPEISQNTCTLDDVDCLRNVGMRQNNLTWCIYNWHEDFYAVELNDCVQAQQSQAKLFPEADT
jgi:hypothetical protein